MGNRTRRRAEAERSKSRMKIGAGVLAILLAAAGVFLGWRALSGGDGAGDAGGSGASDGGSGASEGNGWVITDVKLQMVRPDDEEASEFDERGYRVLFNAVWEGDAKEPPPRALPCTMTVDDGKGNVVHEAEFGLYVGSGEETTTWNPTAIPDDELDAVPSDAELSCEEDETGAYRLTEVQVVRGWLVSYVPRWRGDGEPEIEACEVRLVGEDEKDSSFLDEHIALAPRHDGEERTLKAFVDELTFPPEDAVLNCDLEDDVIIDD